MIQPPMTAAGPTLLRYTPPAIRHAVIAERQREAGRLTIRYAPLIDAWPCVEYFTRLRRASATLHTTTQHATDVKDRRFWTRPMSTRVKYEEYAADTTILKKTGMPTPPTCRRTYAAAEWMPPTRHAAEEPPVSRQHTHHATSPRQPQSQSTLPRPSPPSRIRRRRTQQATTPEMWAAADSRRR